MTDKEPLLTDEAIRYEGIWWLPGNPSLCIPGTATYSIREGTKLTFQGGLASTALYVGLDEMECIFGRTPAGQSITLLDCFEISKQYGLSGGVSASEVFANRMCVGIHLRRLEEPCFAALEFRLSHIDSWVNRHGFKVTPVWSLTHKNVIEYVLPAAVRASYDEGQSLSIEFGFRVSPWSFPQTESSIKQTCCFRTERTGGLNLHDCLSVVGHLLDLISLAAASPTVPLAIKGIPARIDPGHVRWADTGVNIYAPFHLPSSPAKVVLPPHFVFTLHDVEARLSEVLDCWARSRADIPELHDLYFAALSERRPLLADQVLNLTQALEAYHRGRHGGTELSAEQHAERLEGIVQGVPPEQRAWLKEKLRYSNQLALRDRLRRLLEQEPFSALCGGNSKEFINRVVDTRNYFVHYDKPLRCKTATGRELYHLREKLMLLATGALLLELGFPEAGIRDLLSRNPRYRHTLEAQ